MCSLSRLYNYYYVIIMIDMIKIGNETWPVAGWQLFMVAYLLKGVVGAII